MDPLFNTASFDLGGKRYVYSARSGAHGLILVNRQTLSSGVWDYDPSRVAVDMNLYDQGASPPPSVALGTVLRHPQTFGGFFNPVDSKQYRYVMYFIYQGTQTPGSAGVVCLTYSDDGLDWEDPIYARYKHTGGPRGKRCGIDSGDKFYIVKAEAVSGFFRSSSSPGMDPIHLWNLDGDLGLLEQLDGSPTESLTFYDTATDVEPDILDRHGSITLNGVAGLNRPGGTFRNYFTNLDATYDPSSGLLYLFRVYPAPYDSDDPTTPCNNGLQTGYTTLPTHGQVYTMQVGTDPAGSIDGNNAWTRIAEFGQFVGHTAVQNQTCREYVVRQCIPDNEFLFNSATRPNLNMISVHKDPQGLLALDSQGRSLIYFQTADRFPPYVNAKLMAGWFSPLPTQMICANFQVGAVSSNHQVREVDLNGFSEPVVVMGPASFNGNQPGTVRVRDVSSSAFSHSFQEWDYLDGAHRFEEVGFLVLESGATTLGNLELEAGRVDVNHNWTTVSFTQTLSGTPVVLAQVATVNQPEGVAPRIRNVTASGFQLRLQEEEANDGFHAFETVHWIAVTPGTVTIGPNTFVVGRTADVVDDSYSTIAFGQSLSQPLFLAAMQTFDGPDPAALRHRNLQTGSVEVKVEEEQSGDSETGHTTEIVGYIAIGRP